MTRVAADSSAPGAPLPDGCRARGRLEGRVVPLLGGMLVSLVAMPVTAQEPPLPDEPMPRLKLALVLEGLGVHNGGTFPAPVPHDEPLSPAALRLTTTSQRERTEPAAGSPALPPPRPDTPEPKPLSPSTPPVQPRRVAERSSSSSTPPTTPMPLGTVASTDRAPESNSSALAQVVGDDDFLPADELDQDLLPAKRAPGPLEQAAPSATVGNTSRRWGVAPIRWGGEVSIGLRRSSSDSGESQTSQVYEGRLRANSYLWQPYIALVSGDFALTSLRSQDGGGDAASNNLIGTSINGTGSVSVFPQSRFPFSASLSLSDSRSEGSFNDTNVKHRRLGLRQQYRPAVGSWSASATYDRSELDGDFGADIVDRVSGNYNDQFGRHSLSLAGDLAKNRAGNGSTTSAFASASHGLRYNEALSVNTVANIVDQRVRFDSETASLDSRAGSMQVFSFVNWSPIESKWRSNGSLRYFQTYNESSLGSSSERRSVAGSANLSYQASRNLSLSGSIGIGTDFEGETSSAQSASVNYSADASQFGNYSYNWYSSASASNSSSSSGQSSRSVGVTLGHSLSRYWILGQTTSVNANLNQAVSNSRATGAGSVTSTTLTHSAGVSLSASAGDTLNGYLSGNLSDSRTMGDQRSSFQMLNVQLSGSWRIDAQSDLNSNLTWQLTRQDSSGGESIVVTDEFGLPVIIDNSSKSQNSGLGGSLGYNHRRFLGIRGLRYRLDFRANTNTTDSGRRFGDPNASRTEDQVTLDLDQRLMYRIGRLDTEFQYRVGEIQGRRNDLVFIRATRSFGAF